MLKIYMFKKSKQKYNVIEEHNNIIIETTMYDNYEDAASCCAFGLENYLNKINKEENLRDYVKLVQKYYDLKEIEVSKLLNNYFINHKERDFVYLQTEADKNIKYHTLPTYIDNWEHENKVKMYVKCVDNEEDF